MTSSSLGIRTMAAVAWPALSVQAWRYAGGKRDLRLDLLRGFAAVAMVVDHVGGEHSWLYTITGGNRFFVSAAEVFILISGLTMGIVYGRYVVTQGIALVVRKVLRRSAMLYGLTVALTFGFAALSMLLALRWAPQLSWREVPRWVLEVATLQRTFYLVDIPMLYAMLIFAAAPLLYALSRGWGVWVLAGSWSLWAAWQLAPEYAQVPWPIADNTVFNIAPWQVIFVTGLVVGYHREALQERLAGVSIPRLFVCTAVLVAVGIGLVVTQQQPGEAFATNGPLAQQLHGKADVPIGRLAALAIFFAFAMSATTLFWKPIARVSGWLLLPLGQNALAAYSLHIFVVAALARLLPTWGAPRASGHNALIQLVGLVAVWTAIVLYARVAELLAARRAARAPAADVSAAAAQEWGSRAA